MRITENVKFCKWEWVSCGGHFNFHGVFDIKRMFGTMIALVIDDASRIFPGCVRFTDRGRIETMRFLRQFLYCMVALAALSLAVSAQKGGHQKPPPKDPPPKITPSEPKSPPKENKPRNDKPKKPEFSFILTTGREREEINIG